MRCIIVQDGELKSDTRCAYCQRKIVDGYARKIGTRLMYCNFGCYETAEQNSATVGNLPINTWTINS